MSDVRSSDIVAIVCSDIHLSHRAPVARSAEPDWYAAMARPLKELAALKKELQVPIFIVGDLFHKWNPPAELINWAFENLPGNGVHGVYAIPGQHDLPFHRIEDIKKSGFWTLARAGWINNLTCDRLTFPDVMSFYPFPWGKKVTKPEDDCCLPAVALIHAYCWSPGNSYAGAAEESRDSHWRSKLDGYVTGVFGDNHSGFWSPSESKGPSIFNCGGFMRRRIDEKEYRPRVGLLYANGLIKPYYLDTSEDKFIDVSAAIDILDDFDGLQDFVSSLKDLGDIGLNFVDNVKRFCRDNGIGRDTLKKVLTALGED